MKKILILSFFGLLTFGCQTDDLEIVDINFTADKVKVSVNETINFEVSSGADASSIFTGDAGRDFQKSRISLVEQKGYTEEYLRNNLVAERLPNLREFLLRIPENPDKISDFKITDSEVKIYEGKLVKWDVSNVTNSKYLTFKANGGTPQVLTFKPNNAVLPAMLNLNNNNLAAQGALSNVANNTFAPFCSFPDGFTTESQVGQSVKFGVQLVIDGKESRIDYFTLVVRELIDNLGFNLAPLITDWRSKNPTFDPTKGIDEVRLIINADDPAKTDDDGSLLDYVGNVYIQEVRMGSADNMIKAFDRGTTVPYVFPNKNYVFSYKYNKPGTYTATLVSSFVGRKQYKGDGYKTGRADEILASEYPFERTFKNITITVE
jgi:hypothetical protein